MQIIPAASAASVQEWGGGGRVQNLVTHPSVAKGKNFKMKKCLLNFNIFSCICYRGKGYVAINYNLEEKGTKERSEGAKSKKRNKKRNCVCRPTLISVVCLAAFLLSLSPFLIVGHGT